MEIKKYFYKDISSNGIGISFNKIPKGDNIEIITQEEYEKILEELSREEENE